jgi:hypothetical protein
VIAPHSSETRRSASAGHLPSCLLGRCHRPDGLGWCRQQRHLETICPCVHAGITRHIPESSAQTTTHTKKTRKKTRKKTPMRWTFTSAKELPQYQRTERTRRKQPLGTSSHKEESKLWNELPQKRKQALGRIPTRPR